MAKERKHLRVLRAERDITQMRVARDAGLSNSRYWQIENGFGSDPNDDEQAKVAAALGVKKSDIDWPSLKAHAS